VSFLENIFYDKKCRMQTILKEKNHEFQEISTFAFCLFLKIYPFIFRERDTQRKRTSGRGGGRGRENPKWTLP